MIMFHLSLVNLLFVLSTNKSVSTGILIHTHNTHHVLIDIPVVRVLAFCFSVHARSTRWICKIFSRENTNRTVPDYLKIIDNPPSVKIIQLSTIFENYPPLFTRVESSETNTTDFIITFSFMLCIICFVIIQFIIAAQHISKVCLIF